MIVGGPLQTDQVVRRLADLVWTRGVF